MSRIASAFLRARFFRQLVGGEPLVIAQRGREHRVEPGDYLDAELVRELGAAERRRLAQAVPARRVAALVGADIDEAQMVVRPPAGAWPIEPAIFDRDGMNAPARDVRPATLTALPAQSDPGQLRAGWTVACAWGATTETLLEAARAALLERPGAALLLLDHDVEAPAGLGAALARAQADAAYPAANASEPFSLPMPGDIGSPLPRLPGGWSAWEVHDVLAGGEFVTCPGAPERPGAVLLSPPVAARFVEAGRVEIRHPVTVASAYAWRPYDRAGAVAAIVEAEPRRAHGWGEIAERQRRRVTAATVGRPPVGFYSGEVGPWGGVAVLFHLADEFQRLGLHAFVAHHTSSEHGFRPRTGPLRVRQRARMVADWPILAGHPESVVVASHWGSGDTVAEICQRHPGTVATTIIQDREDMFETPDGKPLDPKRFRAYLGLGRGAAVAGWILDSAAEDLGLDRSGYRVIPAGIDTTVFRPAQPRRRAGPVRVLAMWRPQTDVRRGVRLLREVYDTLEARFGRRVSLELFGWDDRTGVGKAPTYARHHGRLAPAQVAALMREVDVVVEPSLYQGFGLPGLEALASGAALASTACRGVDEYAVHEDNALVVPHAELGHAVGRLIEDAALRHRLQAAGPATARRFDWSFIGARWAAYVVELCQEAWGGGGRWAAQLGEVADRAAAVLDGEPCA